MSRAVGAGAGLSESLSLQLHVSSSILAIARRVNLKLNIKNGFKKWVFKRSTK
jgi:hypothetical protein